MTGRRFVRSLAMAATGAWAVTLGALAPAASAEPVPCPDAEVIFARGTGEQPGVGGVGQQFLDSVRAQAGGRSVGEYAVNYAAGSNFDDREAFARSVIDGVRDEGQRVEFMAANCPNTKLILGGYSQGAVVTGFTTSASVPAGVPADLVPAPLSPEVADNVAAVVLFGKPSGQFLEKYGAPAIEIGPLFQPKTLDLCNPGDNICEGNFNGLPSIAHGLYGPNGLVNQGAAYAVGRL